MASFSLPRGGRVSAHLTDETEAHRGEVTCKAVWPENLTLETLTRGFPLPAPPHR